ncbi:MAG: glycerate kinase [Halanaerobiaceae bacterium]|nr:glycerate kinase [Halanaerobiaceae bacterium]
MKILIAPDSFKGSLTAREAADNIEKGILKVYPGAEIYNLPLADGGEGTVDALIYATGGRKIYKEVTGPLGDPVKACFGILGNENIAVIETAAASGLVLVPAGKADPLKATSFGTGELIKAALDEGVDKIIIGLGGSATVDGGVGLVQALGIGFKDSSGKEAGFGGAALAGIKRIDSSNLDIRVRDVEFIIASDVSNPLYGPDGAAYVFGPQKGATPEMVKLLDAGLQNLARVIKKETGKEVARLSGAGAAGGIGAALLAFLDARMKSGIDLILEIYDFDNILREVDLVITGEGRLDRQTLMGKAPFGVAKRANKFNIPVIALAGSVESEAIDKLNQYFTAALSIVQEPGSIEEVMANSKTWLQLSTQQIMQLIKPS